ncbi:winged helix-turn-helix domain-containing protein [Jatrophihabitans sp. YIM 134969]
MTLSLAGHRLEIDDTEVRLDGRVLDLGTAARALLVRLAADPGRVVPREDLLVVLPSAGHAGAHAVEVAVSRLRVALGDPLIVQTVVKRGYRLALD